jgi:hypothetical protein
MSRLLHNRTPAQLGWIIAVANLLVSSCFAAFFVDSFHRPNSPRLPIWAAIVPVALIIFGSILDWFAETALKDGIASEQWPEALIAPARKIFAPPALPAASLLLIVGIAVVFLLGNRHYAGVWIFLFPILSLSRVRGIFNPPRKNAGGVGPVDPPKPLQSEHWGLPPQSSSR